MALVRMGKSAVDLDTVARIRIQRYPGAKPQAVVTFNDGVVDTFEVEDDVKAFELWISRLPDGVPLKPPAKAAAADPAAGP